MGLLHKGIATSAVLMSLFVAAAEAATERHVMTGYGGSVYQGSGIYASGPVYNTITDALAAANNDDTITIHKGPVSTAWTHVLHGNAPGLSGTEPSNLTTGKTGLLIRGKVYSDHLVTIDGNGRTHGVIGGLVLGGTGNTVTDLKFINCYWAGVRLNGTGNHLERVVFNGNHRNGLEVFGVEASATDCQFKNTKEHSVDPSRVGLASGCKNSGLNFTLTDCVALGNGLDGIKATDSGDGFKVIDCESFANNRQGIQIITAENALIQGGSYHDNDASGIQIENNAKDVVIKGVKVYDNNMVHPGFLWVV